ncbi:MAG: hypothetical protein RBT65_15485 [Methanolobus sp.]|nr:hypothetical protein [Methanolobus sp.]
MKDFNEWLATTNDKLVTPSESPVYDYHERDNVKFSIQKYNNYSNIYGTLKLCKNENLEYVIYNIPSTEPDILDAMERIYNLFKKINKHNE